MDGIELDQLRRWVGGRESRVDLITAAPVAALDATLDAEPAAAQRAGDLPPLYHWMYFLVRRQPQDDGLGVKLWARDAAGALCMEASATLHPPH